MQQAISALALRITAAVATYAVVLFLGRWLSPLDYGHFASVISAVTLMTTVTALGLPISLLRFLGQYQARGQVAEARHAMHHGIRMALTLSCLVAAVGVLGGTLILYATSGHPEGFWQSLALQGFGLLLLPAFVSVEVHGAMLRAFGRIFTALAPRDVIWRVLLIPIGLFVSITASPGRQFPILLAIAAATLWGAAAIQARLLWGMVSNSIEATGGRGDSAQRAELQQINRTTRRVWISMVAAVGFNNLDVIAVALFVSAEQAGLYFAASRTAGLAAFALNAVNTVIGPRISAAYYAGDMGQLQRELRFGSMMAFLPALVAFVLVLLFGQEVMGLFGLDFVPMYPVLIILATGQLINGLTGSSGLLLNMTGREAILAHLSLTALCITAVGLALFGYLWGIIGIALVIGITQACYETTVWAMALRSTGFDASVLSWCRKIKYDPPPGT